MKASKSTEAVLTWLERMQPLFTAMADEIWAKPESSWQEFNASRTQAHYLAGQDFSVTWGLAGMNTAFLAEWGEGKPILGFIGEYDALPGLSQKRQSSKEPVEQDAPGHGCGHNLLGTGAVAAAAAVKAWLQASGRSGTVRYYGCPAEEKGTGKVFMGRAGLFDDLDAALNFHPGGMNMPGKGRAVGVSMITYRFFGRTSHAGGSPDEGRSALDAVELMNVGVNYLREHVKDDVRIHYIITEGGKAPNIVPEEAEVYYFVRAAKPGYLAEVVERVNKVAQGAAMMTETRVEWRLEGGVSPLLNNHALADLQYEAMQLIGPIHFSEEEITFAQEINDAMPRTNADYIEDSIDTLNPPAEYAAVLNEHRDKPLIGANLPGLDAHVTMHGSTDVGDLSQIVPVSLLSTTCFTTGSPGHSWANVATAGMSIGHKGMMHAAKIMALTAIGLISEPDHLIGIHEEFQQKTGGEPYQPPIPDDYQPPHFEPQDE